MSTTKADVSNHPIYRSVEDALRAFQVYEKSQETVLEDDGAEMKAALGQFMASLQNISETVETHPDGEIMIPAELLKENADFDAIRIQELEAMIEEDDKIRHKIRHMNDLSQLLEAALDQK